MFDIHRSRSTSLAVALASYGASALGIVILASLLRCLTGAAYPSVMILFGPVQLLTPYFEYPQALLDPIALVTNTVPLILWVGCVTFREKRSRFAVAVLLLAYWFLCGVYFYRMVAYGSA